MNNLFYKSLATISTIGIIVLSTTQLFDTTEKRNNSEIEISKTLIELKKARKEALDEVKTLKSDILKELKTAEKEALKTLEKKSDVSNEKIWLVLVGIGQSIGGGVGIEKIEMANREQCELMGALWSSSERLSNNKNKKVRNVRFECLEGK
ncbi:Hypothetical protein P9215_06521 [Prochlorococcus marinus str. MIT 9215]|uniref:Uncharacterized protein n=1 Tax=Prochlorococcus marinus (strain MIT 9215) TaxID=93060 RepID=A8G3T6_PROM2|nr:hypothetical protein [Prochlorococcus marinus]ABV50267.1 Hypothetical protein P9215_06521 [Prochlorococcus marinus str. MIT 9215]